MASWDAWLAASVESLHRDNLFRVLRPTIPGSSPVEVSVTATDLEAWLAGEAPARAPPSLGGTLPSMAHRPDVRTIKLFSLNDYLGLSTHPAVCMAAAQAALACGNGPRSSALVGGYTSHHRELELALAALKGQERRARPTSDQRPPDTSPALLPSPSPQQDCLLFPTGYAANLAVASVLAGAADVAVFSDELNHASIVDGARLVRRAGAALHVYRHNDMEHLERLLDSCPSGVRRLVLTDTLFSMDGDYADLRALVALRARHGFLLAADDAHGTLVDLHVGTLSKAFGCHGGFVACSRRWKDLLVNRGRGQVFSTALPEPWRRRHLYQLAQQLGGPLGLPARSPILPLVLGSEAAAMDAATALLRSGFHVPAIRPPTVPAGTSRLRLSLSAGHRGEDVGALLAALADHGLVDWRRVKAQQQQQQQHTSESSTLHSQEDAPWDWQMPDALVEDGAGNSWGSGAVSRRERSSDVLSRL
eukprot:scaffold19.g1839.t1